MHSDLTSRRWTVADIRARAEHGLAECRAGLAGAGDKVLDRLFASPGRDGALERALRDGLRRWSRERTKPMSGALTLLFALSARGEAASTLQSIAARGLPGSKAVSGLQGASEPIGSAGDLPVFLQHKRANETVIALMREGQSLLLGSAPPLLCTATWRLAVASFRFSRRRQ